MSEEKKDGCCSTEKKCCNTRRLIFVVLFGALLFMAGVLFGKTCPLGGGATMCPMTTHK